MCSGDRIVGVVGGGMDEFSALMLRNMIRGAEQHHLPPGLRGLQHDLQMMRVRALFNRPEHSFTHDVIGHP